MATGALAHQKKKQNWSDENDMEIEKLLNARKAVLVAWLRDSASNTNYERFEPIRQEI